MDVISACREAGTYRGAAAISGTTARCSVPVALIGEQVSLRTDDGKLLVVLAGTGEAVAEHVLVPPGEASVRDEHYGGPRPAPRRAVRPKTADEKAFCALGPAGHGDASTRPGLQADSPVTQARSGRH